MRIRTVFAMATALASLPGLCFAASDDLTAQVRLLNETVTQALPAVGEAPLIRLLQQRRTLIAQLIKDDAAAVGGVALGSTVSDQLRRRSPGLAGLLEANGEWTGSLEVLAEMDFEKHTASTRRFLRTTTERVELFGGARTFLQSDSMGGSQVRVDGIRSERLVAVDTLASTLAASVPGPSGVQKYAVLVVTSPANPVFPSGWNLTSIQNIFFGTSGSTLNTYWQEASYGKTSAQGLVFGPFVIPQGYSCTASDTSDSEKLRQDAITAAQGAVDFTQYSRIAIVFPDNACNYGGLGSIGAATYADLPQSSSIAWFPVFNQNSINSYVRILAHEAGHNLGLNHANSEDFGAVALGAPGADGVNTEYGDPFSVMGVGEQGSASLTTGQYSAQHKAQILGWLNSSGFQQVTSSGSYSVLPLEESSGLRGLRILRDQASRSWLWLESRQPIGQIDSTLSGLSSNLFSGAMIHYENPDLESGHTYLLDFQPSSTPNNFLNSAMTAGQSWTDPFSLLRLTVNSAGASGVSVDVHYDSPCATLVTSGTLVSVTGGVGTIQVTAPATCAWTASTSSSWILLGGVTQGTGNGTASFTVGANSGGAQRNGFIVVQRQSVQVIQEGPGLTGVGVSPAVGSGTSGTLTFQFADSKGYTDVDFANGVIGGSAYSNIVCDFSASRSGYIWLADASGNFTVGPVYLNQPGTSISNSTCTIFADGSSISGAGNILTFAVRFQFAGSVSGFYRVFGWPHNSAGYSGPFAFGEWTIPAARTASCDINLDGNTNVSDVQLMVNEALGLVVAVHDLNSDGVVNVADVQIIVNAALGLGCILP